MTEQVMDLASLGVTADAPSQPAGDRAPGTTGEPPVGNEPSKGAMLQRSADAKMVDEHIKTALRQNIVNHELACFVTDLVSPGYALERMGGLALDKLPPMQHMLIACSAVLGIVLVTNPDIAKKLKSSVMGKAPPAEKAIGAGSGPRSLHEEVAEAEVPPQPDVSPEGEDTILHDLSGMPL